MLPECRDDVGQHAFGYAYLMAVEFYDNQPTDYLGLAREERPEDCLECAKKSCTNLKVQ